MGYLDSAGLEYFWGKVKRTLPGPQGPAGPDGNPIGTIISFMGTSAPEDYLVCDGTQHSISQYPALAAFFQAQFGSKNHFGGDGETTFALPDMRERFLINQSENYAVGSIGGEKEVGLKASELPKDIGTFDALRWDDGTVGASGAFSCNQAHIDRTASRSSNFGQATFTLSGGGEAHNNIPPYMTVLYCIKAVESVPAEEVYSTEERRIGTWIDGKPLYRKCFSGNISFATYETAVPLQENFRQSCQLIRAYGIVHMVYPPGSAYDYPFPVGAVGNYVFCLTDQNGLLKIVSKFDSAGNGWYNAAIEYTKTTD